MTIPAKLHHENRPASTAQETITPRTSTGAPRTPSICFVAHFAYGAITGGRSGHIGGVERQTSLMAKWFAARGYPVSIITWADGLPQDECIDGVAVIKMCRKDEGLRGLRFLHPRWTSLVQAMRRANAEVYYQNCAEYVTGQVAMWCRANSKRFVYSVASDPDCDVQLPQLTTLRERILYRYGLKHADRIVVQTRSQEAMLKRGFGLSASVLPMPCAVLEPSKTSPAQESFRTRKIIWVGRIAPVKRVEWFVQLAQLLPQYDFSIVGPAEHTEYADAALSQAQRVKNLRLIGSVPREEIANIYAEASCLCCTSEYEGFPNTFLEAWSCGIPVVSTIDPDNIISGYSLGTVAQDVEGLAISLRRLMESQRAYQVASTNARKYFNDYHTVESAMPRFERVFVETYQNGLPKRERTTAKCE